MFMLAYERQRNVVAYVKAITRYIWEEKTFFPERFHPADYSLYSKEGGNEFFLIIYRIVKAINNLSNSVQQSFCNEKEQLLSLNNCFSKRWKIKQKRWTLACKYCFRFRKSFATRQTLAWDFITRVKNENTCKRKDILSQEVKKNFFVDSWTFTDCDRAKWKTKTRCWMEVWAARGLSKVQATMGWARILYRLEW